MAEEDKLEHFNENKLDKTETVSLKDSTNENDEILILRSVDYDQNDESSSLSKNSLKTGKINETENTKKKKLFFYQETDSTSICESSDDDEKKKKGRKGKNSNKPFNASKQTTKTSSNYIDIFARPENLFINSRSKNKNSERKENSWNPFAARSGGGTHPSPASSSKMSNSNSLQKRTAPLAQGKSGEYHFKEDSARKEKEIKNENIWRPQKADYSKNSSIRNNRKISFAKTDKSKNNSLRTNSRNISNELNKNNYNQETMNQNYIEPEINVPKIKIPENMTYTSAPVSGLTVHDTNPSPKHITLETSDPVYDAMNKLIEKKEIPPPELQRNVLSLLKKETIRSIVTEEYDYAQSVEEAALYLRRSMEQELMKAKAEHDKQVMEQRIDKVRKEILIENEEWDSYLQEFGNEQKKLRLELLQRHKKELKNYEEKWSDPNMMIPFSKPSPQLLQLRRQQKSLALTKNFAEAKLFKQKADELQKKEAVEAEKRAIVSIRNGYQLLLEKHQKEIQCFDEHEQRSLTYIKTEKMKMIEPLEKLYQSLKNSKESKNDSNIIIKKQVEKDDSIPQATPRTKMALYEFRVSDDHSRLNINGVKLRRFVASRRASSSHHRISRITK